jgi:hypothetical protein
MNCLKQQQRQKRLLAISLVALSVIGFWVVAEAAETKAKAPAQQKPPAKQSFLPCHPPQADMSPDGKFFVHIIEDQPMLSVLEMGAEQKNSQIKLPKKAHDAVFIDNARVVVSYGAWGEVAVIDVKKATVGDPLQVGASAEGMCRIADGRIVVIDSKKDSIHLVDPNGQAVLKTIPVKSKPAQMRWAVQDLEIEVADAQGKILGAIELPRQSPQEKRGTK